MELRFIERGGKKVLQSRTEAMDGESSYMTEWRDVPLVSDPPKSRRQEKVEELRGYVYGSPLPLAEAALEWVERQLPQEVDVAAVKRSNPLNDLPFTELDARIQFAKGTNQALSDVRRNLGLDS